MAPQNCQGSRVIYPVQVKLNWKSIFSTNWICKEPHYSWGSSFFSQHFLFDKRLEALSSAQWGCPRQSLFCSERGNSARPLGRMRDQCGRQIVQACNEPNSRGLPLHLQEQDHRQALWCILQETTQRSSFFLRVCSTSTQTINGKGW